MTSPNTASRHITKNDLDLDISTFDLTVKIAECIDLIIAVKADIANYNPKPRPSQVIKSHILLCKLDIVRAILLQELKERRELARLKCKQSNQTGAF
jgi:hypothetical protein